MWAFLLSVPSTRAYAMKLVSIKSSRNASLAFSTLNSGLRDETSPASASPAKYEPFSTLNSGLRDETLTASVGDSESHAFQYPQLGPTR